MFLEQHIPNWDFGVDSVDVVGVEIDQERRVCFVQELKQRVNDQGPDGFLELGGGGGKRRRHDVDEREGGGDRNCLNAEVKKGEVEVAHGGEEGGGGVEGRIVVGGSSYDVGAS